MSNGEVSEAYRRLLEAIENAKPEKAKRAKPYGSSLSPREKEIAIALATGMTNSDIAEALDLSVSTVDTHRRMAYKALGVRNSAQLVNELVRRGIYRIPGTRGRPRKET